MHAVTTSSGLRALLLASALFVPTVATSDSNAVQQPEGGGVNDGRSIFFVREIDLFHDKECTRPVESVSEMNKVAVKKNLQLSFISKLAPDIDPELGIRLEQIRSRGPMDGFYPSDCITWYHGTSAAPQSPRSGVRLDNLFELTDDANSSDTRIEDLRQFLQSRTQENHSYIIRGIDQTFFAAMRTLKVYYGELHVNPASQWQLLPAEFNVSQEFSQDPQHPLATRFHVGEVALFAVTVEYPDIPVASWVAGVVTRIHRDGTIDGHLFQEKVEFYNRSNVRKVESRAHHDQQVKCLQSLCLDAAEDKRMELEAEREAFEKKLRTVNDLLAVEKTERERETGEHKRKCAEYERTMDALRQDNTTLQQRFDDHAAEAAEREHELAAQVASLTDERNVLHQSLNEAAETRTDLTAQVTALVNERDEARQQFDDSTREAAEERTRLTSEAAGERTRLEAQMAKLREERDGRRPVWWTYVIAGVGLTCIAVSVIIVYCVVRRGENGFSTEQIVEESVHDAEYPHDQDVLLEEGARGSEADAAPTPVSPQLPTVPVLRVE